VELRSGGWFVVQLLCLVSGLLGARCRCSVVSALRAGPTGKSMVDSRCRRDLVSSSFVEHCLFK